MSKEKLDTTEEIVDEVTIEEVAAEAPSPKKKLRKAAPGNRYSSATPAEKAIFTAMQKVMNEAGYPLKVSHRELENDIKKKVIFVHDENDQGVFTTEFLTSKNEVRNVRVFSAEPIEGLQSLEGAKVTYGGRIVTLPVGDDLPGAMAKIVAGLA